MGLENILKGLSGAKPDIRQVKCVICARELLKLALVENLVSAEVYESSQRNIDYLIESYPHRRRLACGFEHYEELMEIVEGIKRLSQPKKCLNSKCKHTEAKHEPGGGSCNAARCKCSVFSQNQNNVSAAITDNEEIKRLVEEAKKLLEQPTDAERAS